MGYMKQFKILVEETKEILEHKHLLDNMKAQHVDVTMPGLTWIANISCQHLLLMTM